MPRMTQANTNLAMGEWARVFNFLVCDLCGHNKMAFRPRNADISVHSVHCTSATLWNALPALYTLYTLYIVPLLHFGMRFQLACGILVLFLFLNLVLKHIFLN